MGFMKRPKAPEPTAQELAAEQRTSRMLDEEIEESEKRLKAAARGKLGASSLLAQATKASGGGARRSMMGAGSTGSGNMVGESSRQTAANTGVTVKRYAK